MTASVAEPRKLTIRIDGAVIDQAKEYVAATDTSLSRLIENYLKAVVKKPESKPVDELRLTPWVRELYGILEGTGIDENTYYKHLEEKYL